MHKKSTESYSDLDTAEKQDPQAIGCNGIPSKYNSNKGLSSFAIFSRSSLYW